MQNDLRFCNVEFAECAIPIGRDPGSERILFTSLHLHLLDLELA